MNDGVAAAIEAAPLWRRALALVLDIAAAYVVYFVVAVMLVQQQMAGVIVSVSAFWLYKPVCEWAGGRTLGKLVFGCKVVTIANEPLPFGMAIMRNLMLFFPPLFPGVVLALFNPRHRGLHDVISGTRVISPKGEVNRGKKRRGVSG